MERPEPGPSAPGDQSVDVGALDIGVLVAASLILLVAVASATAIRNYRWPRLERIVPPGERRDELGEKLDEERRLLDGLSVMRLVAALLLIICSLSLANAGGPLLGPSADPLGFLADLGLMLGVFVFGVQGLARGLARAAPEQVLLLLMGPALLLSRIATPLVWLSEGTGLVFARAFGLARDKNEDEEAREEILDAVTEGGREGAIAEGEREMIENIIEVADQAVSEVMTPRTSVFALAIDTPLHEAVSRIVEEGHSRIPVYEESIDEVRGILYAKDLLPYWGKAESEVPSIADLVRRASFTPETKKTSELLQELRQGKVHLAIVLDEYGGMAGLVTIEDILEEIVGEIEDEYDQEEDPEHRSIEQFSEHEAEVAAIVHIDELNDLLHTELPEDDNYDTVGGLLFAHLGRVPEAGEECELDGVRFEIVDADERRIRRVKVTVSP